MVWRLLIAALVILPIQSAFAFRPDLTRPVFSNQEQGDQYIASSPDIADVASPDQVAAEMGYSADARVKAPSNARLQILIDKAHRHEKASGSKTGQTLEMYLDGILIGKYNVSTGRERRELAKSGRRYFSSTPTGTYGIYNRNVRHWSNTWKAWMPYSQFLVGGIAIHATTPDHYSELGTRASGGCIRLSNKNAKTLWDLVKITGVKNTSVTIFDSTKQFNWMNEMLTNSKQKTQQKVQQPMPPTMRQSMQQPRQSSQTEEENETAELNRRELKRIQSLQRSQEEYQNQSPGQNPEQSQEQYQINAPMPESFYGIY